MDKGPAATLESVERLRATVKANPRSTAFVVLAHQLSELGRAAEAEEVARRGLEQHPGLPTGEVALARALAEGGKLRDAQAVLVGTVRDHPRHADAFRWLAEVLVRRGDFDRAKAIVQHALDLAPTDERVIELMRELGADLPDTVPRPKTDFEATRIADGEAIARRMEGGNEQPTVIRAMDDLIPASQPTVIREVPVPPAARPGRATPAGAARTIEVDDAALATGMEEILGLLPRPVLDAARPTPSPDSDGFDDAVTPTPTFEPRGGSRARPSTESDSPASLPGHRPSPVGAPAIDIHANRGPIATPIAGGVAVSARYRATLGRRRVFQAAAVAALGVVVVGGVTQGVVRYRAHERAREQRNQMTIDIAVGSLGALLRAREAGIRLLAIGLDEGDVAADLAFVCGLLAREYALAADDEAVRAAARSDASGAPHPSRAGTVGAARALVALGGGKLTEAVDRAVRAEGVSPRSPYVQTALARARLLQGDIEAARAALDRALGASPEFGPAAVALGELLIEQGDAALAIAHLEKLVARTPEHTRARLLLAEARRARGDRSPGADKTLAAACREDGSLSPAVSAACALGSAEDARLSGQRARALELVREAVAIAPPEPRILAGTADLLAGLGQIEASADLAERAARYSSNDLPAVAWARVAVTLGSGIGSQSVPVGRSATIETCLLAARAADASGHPGELAAVLAAFPKETVAADPDLKAFALFAAAPVPAAGAPLSRNLTSGPVGAYLAGRIARQARQPEVALLVLPQALDGHGDVCRAAAEYRAALVELRRDPQADAVFRAFTARKLPCMNLAVAPAPAPPAAPPTPPGASPPMPGAASLTGPTPSR